MKDIFVARQPIFDADGNVAGYELLYRAHADASVAAGTSAVTMSSSVIVDAVLGLGLDKLTDGHRAFINLSEEMFLDGTADLLDPASVVIELLESVPATPDIVEVCRDLVGKGYKLALDDFAFEAGYEPLLHLAEIVKVDVIESAANLDQLVESLRPFNVKLLAEKVENNLVHDRCVQLGFSYFQGFHYFRPETLTRKDMPAQSLSVIRLMNMLQDVNVTDRVIEETLRSDPSMTYKLLRIVNSAALGGRGVQSIAHALRLLGREPLYRWLCLLMMSADTDDNEMRVEMIKSALLRARMCELVGDKLRSPEVRDIPDGGSLFLVGLFAQIDQILGVTVPDILAEIDVSTAVRDALLLGEGKAGRILIAVEAYADADWDFARQGMTDASGDPEILPDLYLDALTWASDRMSMQA